MMQVNDVIKTFRDIDPGETLLVCGYELGDLYRDYMKSLRHPEDARLYLADGKLAIADLITQLRSFCEYYNFDFGELIKMGEDHLEETADERRRDKQKGTYSGH